MAVPNIVVVVIAILSLALGQQQRQIDPEIEQKLNDYIHNVYLPAAKVSTLGLTIVQNEGEILYTNGYGLANVEKQIPNTNETRFIIASISKSFTAVVLVKTLNEKFPELGESVLDTPIRKLIPEFNFTLIDRFRSEHGTIRDLLGHRMCLANADFPYGADAIETSAEFAYRQRYSEELCGIRSDFQYNNMMYILAGEILSFLSGKLYVDTVEDFLKEIGMTKSHFVRRTDDFANTPEIARPYLVNMTDGKLITIPPEFPLRAATISAAGGLVASPNEMERYLQFHMNLGKLNGKQIVPEEVMRWLRKPVIHTPPRYRGFAYGQGLILSEYKGWEYINHAGDLSPYESLLSLYPTQNLSIFSSTNQGPLQTDRHALHTFIFETLNGAEDADEQAKRVHDEWKLNEDKKKKMQEEAMEKFMTENVFSEGHLQNRAEIVGKYGSGTAGDVEIFEKWNNETNEMGLYLQYGKYATGFLEPVGDALYKIAFDTEILLDFAGTVDAVFLRADEESIEYLTISDGEETSVAKFWLGVSLDKLPPIPWLPGSCRAQ